jgi:hypothetical protein
MWRHCWSAPSRPPPSAKGGIHSGQQHTSLLNPELSRRLHRDEGHNPVPSAALDGICSFCTREGSAEGHDPGALLRMACDRDACTLPLRRLQRVLPKAFSTSLLRQASAGQQAAAVWPVPPPPPTAVLPRYLATHDASSLNLQRKAESCDIKAEKGDQVEVHYLVRPPPVQQLRSGSACPRPHVMAALPANA